jgi:hypothetical protein
VGSINAQIRRRRGRVLLAVCATALLAALPAAPPVASAQLRTVSLRIPLPRLLSEEGRGPLASRSLVGEADLQIPAGWARRRPSVARIGVRLAVKLAPGCEAKIELITGASMFTRSARAEVQGAIFSYFAGHQGPPHPLPVTTIAKHISTQREWELIGAPAGPLSAAPDEAPIRERSPMYGVEVQRIAAPSAWASLTVGVWAPVACFTDLPRRAYLQSAIEGMLRSARLHAHIGPPSKH